MGLLDADRTGKLALSEMAREHLIPGGDFYVGDYVGLGARTPGVLEMVQRLKSNRPAADKPPSTDEAQSGKSGGTAFIYREGSESAMEDQDSARRLTLGLAGRARNVAPVLARNYPLPEARRLLDIGGGTGIYTLALLVANPALRAVIWDRPQVLKVAGVR